MHLIHRIKDMLLDFLHVHVCPHMHIYMLMFMYLNMHLQGYIVYNVYEHTHVDVVHIFSFTLLFYTLGINRVESVGLYTCILCNVCIFMALYLFDVAYTCLYMYSVHDLQYIHVYVCFLFLGTTAVLGCSIGIWQ